MVFWVRPVIQIASKLAQIDYKVMRGAGWKPGAARGISHGIFGGTTIANSISNRDNGLNGGPISTSSYFQSQTRSGFKRKYCSRYSIKYGRYGCRPNPSANYSRSNRYRRKSKRFLPSGRSRSRY